MFQQMKEIPNYAAIDMLDIVTFVRVKFFYNIRMPSGSTTLTRATEPWDWWCDFNKDKPHIEDGHATFKIIASRLYWDEVKTKKKPHHGRPYRHQQSRPQRGQRWHSPPRFREPLTEDSRWGDIMIGPWPKVDPPHQIGPPILPLNEDRNFPQNGKFNSSPLNKSRNFPQNDKSKLLLRNPLPQAASKILRLAKTKRLQSLITYSPHKSTKALKIWPLRSTPEPATMPSKG